MLVFLVLAIFVGGPLVATGVAGEFLLGLFFSLLLLSGVVAISRRRVLAILTLVLVLATFGVRWTGRWSPGSTLDVWYTALSMACLFILMVLVLVQVFREGPVTAHRIQGAIVAYLLAGLIWANAYELLYGAMPGAFRLPEAASGAQPVRHWFAYFSFVTLTTLGYGDITPVHPLARSLAIGEALFGQLYPAILIARLVSMELESRQRH